MNTYIPSIYFKLIVFDKILAIQLVIQGIAAIEQVVNTDVEGVFRCAFGLEINIKAYI